MAHDAAGAGAALQEMEGEEMKKWDGQEWRRFYQWGRKGWMGWVE